jgi:hypothetical protein
MVERKLGGNFSIIIKILVMDFDCLTGIDMDKMLHHWSDMGMEVLIILL